MTKEFDKNDIARIANLAALHIEEEAAVKYSATLSNTFRLINQMQQINTDGVEPMSHPLDAHQRLRADEVTIGNKRDALLACAPRSEVGLILVPKVIE